jgi:DNA mismatch repair protein MSH6
VSRSENRAVRGKSEFNADASLDMFASASTFKVELDECSKILREAGPRSFVILDGESRSRRVQRCPEVAADPRLR